MSPEHGLQPRPSSLAERSTTTRPVVPILISVPVLGAPGARPGHARRRTSLRPRRRRLRREVRMAGIALLSTVPMALASSLFLGRAPASLLGSVPPVPREVRVPDVASVHRSPVISITIEPASLVTPGETEPPVVFPGYLLPDDGPEEPAHAGS